MIDEGCPKEWKRVSHDENTDGPALFGNCLHSSCKGKGKESSALDLLMENLPKNARCGLCFRQPGLVHFSLAEDMTGSPQAGSLQVSGKKKKN